MEEDSAIGHAAPALDDRRAVEEAFTRLLNRGGVFSVEFSADSAFLVLEDDDGVYRAEAPGFVRGTFIPDLRALLELELAAPILRSEIGQRPEGQSPLL